MMEKRRIYNWVAGSPKQEFNTTKQKAKTPYNTVFLISIYKFEVVFIFLSLWRKRTKVRKKGLYDKSRKINHTHKRKA